MKYPFIQSLHQKRLKTLYIVLVVLLLFMAYRLYRIQFVENSLYLAEGKKTHTRTIKIERKRGNIYDRNGKELAISKNSYSLYFQPKGFENTSTVLDTVSSIIGVDRSTLLEKIVQNDTFVWIKRWLEDEEVGKLRKLNLPGVGLKPIYRRFYPRSSIASSIVGFVGVDDIGLEGMEFYFEKYLRAKSGTQKFKSDVSGNKIPESEEEIVEPEGGCDLYLTIDEVIQLIVEEEIAMTAKQYSAKSVTAVVIDPPTGKILGLGVYPTYQNSNYSSASYYNRKCRAITDVYEPGSTFKVITVAAAMQSGVVDKNFTTECQGSIKINDKTMKCHIVHGEIGLDKILWDSCNMGTIAVGKKLGKERFYDFIKEFGFGSRTGLNFPGEARGLLKTPRDWPEIDLYSISYGQAIGVTPVQLLAAVNVVFNDGKFIPPKIVEKLVDYNGNIVNHGNEMESKQIISSDIARSIKDMLKKTVSMGTGKRCAIEGLEVAGKTGTAQKGTKGGYSETQYISSFVGFVPADKPKLGILVIVDEPIGNIYGGVVAADAFRNIVTRTFRHLNYDSRDNKDFFTFKDSEYVTVPNFVGVGREKSDYEKYGELNVYSIGNGSQAAYQYPFAGTRVRRESDVFVYYVDFNSVMNSNNNAMPFLLGMTFRDALKKMQNLLEVKLKIVGSGIAVRQFPIPGSVLHKNDEVILYFSE